MKYKYVKDVRNNDILRKSFNELTRKTFGFDFVKWYERGHWQDKYIPHVLVDGDKVVSNVSVNLMSFMVDGEMKSFIQLGTVMTGKEYRGQGLNRYIMEHIMEEYRDKVDGIYLFGNDSVLEYYPKFGFKQAKEYEYSLRVESITDNSAEKLHRKAYTIHKINMSDAKACEKFYEAVNESYNSNDGFYMCNNLGLYQFWLASEFKNSIYHVPEMDAYVVADKNGSSLMINQIFSKKKLDFEQLAVSFSYVGDVTDGNRIEEIKFGFTPIDKADYEVRGHKEEDCTLFIIGEELEKLLGEKMMFPVMSHA